MSPGYFSDVNWFPAFVVEFIVCLPWYMAAGRIYVWFAFLVAMKLRKYQITPMDRDRFIDDKYMRVRPIALCWGAPWLVVFSWLLADDWNDFFVGNIFTAILTFAIWRIKKKKPPKKRHLAGALARIKDLGGRLVIVPLPAPT